MDAKLLRPETEKVAVDKQDLVAAWSLLERVVVSLRKMGSYYATSGPEVPLPPEKQQEMLEALNGYFTAELCQELSSARVNLGEYLPDDEAEAISDSLEYWKPPTKRPPATKLQD
jgi:hypothetical protein